MSCPKWYVLCKIRTRLQRLDNATEKIMQYLINYFYMDYIFRASQVALVIKNPPTMQGTWVGFMGQEEGNGSPLQYSCLKNSMERGAWWTTVHRVTESEHMLK